MNRQKNIYLWHRLALVLLLCLSIPVISIGIAFARYKTDKKADMEFIIREQAEIQLGMVVTNSEGEVFSPSKKPEWKITENTATLDIAVSGASHYTEGKQRVKFHLISGLGLTTENGVAKVTITATESGSDKSITANATGTNIQKGSRLYNQYGDGWVLMFFDENGKELCWDIKGGSLNYVKITVTVDISDVDMESIMLQPHFVIETAE